jgi:hypothetical protein
MERVERQRHFGRVIVPICAAFAGNITIVLTDCPTPAKSRANPVIFLTLQAIAIKCDANSTDLTDPTIPLKNSNMRKSPFH